MISFLLKILLVAAVVVGVIGVVYMRRGSMPRISELPGKLKDSLAQVNTTTLWSNLSGSLDSLVTNPDANSPVVLGVKITNDSLTTVVDVIQSLPPDQITQIRSALCTPAPSATPSAR